MLAAVGERLDDGRLDAAPADAAQDPKALRNCLDTMSDDASDKPAAKTVEAPMMSWMRGGTMTSAYERQLAQQKAAAERARAVEDSKTRAAENDPEHAKQYKRVVGGNKSFAGIVLEVRHPRDNVVLDYVECELTLDEVGALVLNMACPKCALRGVTDNFKFSQRHKRFELDTRRQGELWVNPRNPRHIVTLAGTIQLTEAVTCPNLGCGFRFKIDSSVIREI